MKNLPTYLILFIGIIFSQQISHLFSTDVRIRVVDKNLLYVVVQIDNDSGRPVRELEGYVTEIDLYSNIITEQKLFHHHEYEPPLASGQTTVRGITYPVDSSKRNTFEYHISRIKFENDSRTYLFTPSEGLLRID